MTEADKTPRPEPTPDGRRRLPDAASAVTAGSRAAAGYSRQLIGRAPGLLTAAGSGLRQLSSAASQRWRETRVGQALAERRIRRSAMLSIGLAVAGPILALMTYATLSSADQTTLGAWWFRALILADIVYFMALFALIGMQIARLVIARRAHTAGSKLHGRMVAVFTGVAAAPAIIVAIFFFLVIQLGFDAWFNEQVGSVVRNSRAVANAYAEEHHQAIRGEAIAFASQLSEAARDLIGGPENPRFQVFLERASESLDFSEIYILNSTADIIARGPTSFLFAFTPPSLEDLARAQSGAVVVSEDRDADEMRALLRLQGLFDAYLYVARPVDGEVLKSLEETNRGVQLYNRLEENRDVWMARFAALYLGFVVLVLTAAIYLGLWFAERLAKPIGRLAAAAQRVRSGERLVRVKEERGDDEIALLSRVFNKMTEEVERKRDELTEAHAESEDRRMFSEAVLAGVTAGVIGLDADGVVQLLNRSAATLLGLDRNVAVGHAFTEIAPEFAAMFEDAQLDPAKGVEKPVRVLRDGQERELLARITSQREERDGHPQDARTVAGYVVTLDDLTALVAAERLAAWGDVARRVAHEIKNPLTPIQLSAERLRRKFSDRLGEDSERFDGYIETIVRQTADIGRMVDAFVRFAKLPTPKMARESAPALLREAVVLQREARAHIKYAVELPEDADSAGLRCDRGQILQALTNLLQNAADSIDERKERGGPESDDPPEVRVAMSYSDTGDVVFEFADNGVGLPDEQRHRLLEPYVTTREKGTGLGLAIVQKIIEEHGGYFELTDAPPFSPGAHPGALARITLPKAPSERPENDQSRRRDSDNEDGGASSDRFAGVAE